jgi:hypothetical protein
MRLAENKDKEEKKSYNWKMRNAITGTENYIPMNQKLNISLIKRINLY